MDVAIGIPKKNLAELDDALHQILATTYALYLKTQAFHWNVKGSDFFSLHLLFEKHYEEMAEAVDEIAERLASLGVYIKASFTEFHRLSAIKIATAPLSAEEMLEELVRSHEHLCLLGRPLIKRFQELTDEVSADLLIKRLTFHEKAAWMLRSHLSLVNKSQQSNSPKKSKTR